MSGEERCELTELLVSSCAHCRPDAEPVRRRRDYAGHPYTANYVTRCGVCGLCIDIGDPIAQDTSGGPWVHEECA